MSAKRTLKEILDTSIGGITFLECLLRLGEYLSDDLEDPQTGKVLSDFFRECVLELQILAKLANAPAPDVNAELRAAPALTAREEMERETA